mmetsp:Transcript_11008/g.26613  ORF Transcript_11008/g.26613 Transcript_11008/m.26613 type:complete len:186 (+) Transcript_11008:90-647(+)
MAIDQGQNESLMLAGQMTYKASTERDNSAAKIIYLPCGDISCISETYIGFFCILSLVGWKNWWSNGRDIVLFDGVALVGIHHNLFRLIPSRKVTTCQKRRYSRRNIRTLENRVLIQRQVEKRCTLELLAVEKEQLKLRRWQRLATHKDVHYTVDLNSYHTTKDSRDEFLELVGFAIDTRSNKSRS